jgi:hypothetical protein
MFPPNSFARFVLSNKAYYSNCRAVTPLPHLVVICVFEFFPRRLNRRRAPSILSQLPCENRLPASTGGAEVTGACRKNRPMNLGQEVKNRSGEFRKKTKKKKPEKKKLSRGASLRGQGSPGLSCPPPQ